MDKQKRLEMIYLVVTEVKRLRDEEHVHDLVKAGRYDEIKAISCKSSIELLEALENGDFYLELNEIPDNGYLLLAIWMKANNIIDSDLLCDWEGFAKGLAKEDVNIGKFIAYKLRNNESINKIVVEDFGVDILDEEEQMELQMPEGKIIKKNYVGEHLKNYNSLLVVSHFKGHPMGRIWRGIKKYFYWYCFILWKSIYSWSRKSIKDMDN